MLVTGPHRILFSMLNKILNEKYGGSQHLSEKKRLKSKSASLVDFGARIKIKVSQFEGISQIELEATFLEDYEIHNETIDYLRELYGMSVGFTRFDDQHKVTISVIVNDAIAHFDSPQTCAMSLSQIRVQAAGAPILKDIDNLFSLLIHYQFCRVMVVFIVAFEEEMERCLARLFLQQFEVTQRKVPLTPHCEFRRPNQATKELKCVMSKQIESEDDRMPPAVGYLSFTFFPSSAASEARRLKAVDLLVNFLPYINRHVKSTKSMMLNRMRSKRSDLLPSMQDPATMISW